MTGQDFAGKVVLVTGGASGIGEACALEFAARGASVVLADLDRNAADRVVARAAGALTALDTDVCDAASVEAAIGETVAIHGRLDVAVNNAGVFGGMAPLADQPLEQYRRTIATDLDGVFYGMYYEIPAMLAGGGGVIVNVSSIAGHAAVRNLSAYTAAKHAVLGLTRGAALEYATQGIRVVSVSPGLIRTPMTDSLPDGFAQWAESLEPVGRMGDPAEVAAMVCFLASAKASFITGSDHPVDGGFLAGR